MSLLSVSRSEAVQVGDVIRAINGIQTNQMKHSEVADILLNSGPVISLQLEFDSAQGRMLFIIHSVRTWMEIFD